MKSISFASNWINFRNILKKEAEASKQTYFWSGFRYGLAWGFSVKKN